MYTQEQKTSLIAFIKLMPQLESYVTIAALKSHLEDKSKIALCDLILDFEGCFDYDSQGNQKTRVTYNVCADNLIVLISLLLAHYNLTNEAQSRAVDFIESLLEQVIYESKIVEVE